MPFNGSGGTSQPASSIYPASANTLIESAKFNISIADIYTMLASCIVKDGQTTTTAALPFASGIKTDDINENTVGDGVTIDGALIKDGRIDTTQGSDIASAATINLETATGNVVDVTGTTGITAVTLSQGHWRLVRFTGALTITNGASLVLPNAADYTTSAGDYVLFVGYASSVVRAYILPTNGPIPFVDSQPVVVGSADKTKKFRLEVDGLTTGTIRVATAPDYDIRFGNLPAGIGPLPYAGSTIPTGWLECDGSAVSRTTYAALFTAIGTTWGTGDGSTTFNLPDMRGKVAIGSGTGTVTASGLDADVDTTNDTLTVASNNTKWVTGMSVVFTLSSGTITGLTSGNTYYVIRASATTVKLASSLANAQNGTAVDMTAKSSPVWSITHTYTARTLGEYGGEEAHAMSSTELLAHTHTILAADDGGGGSGVANLNNSGANEATESTGGNAAMNIMQPFAVVKYIISY